MTAISLIHLVAIPSPINDIAEQLGANDLPYAIPIHPNLVHFTIGLFAIGIAFDFAGAFYPLEKRVFRYLALPVTRSGFHDVGWYNVLACSVITFFTVAAGFYEMLLAVPLPGIRSLIGQNAISTMLWHGIGGVILLLSGSLPVNSLRLQWFQNNLPLPFIESSHLLASLAGLALLVMAHALLRRRHRSSSSTTAAAACGLAAPFMASAMAAHLSGSWSSRATVSPRLSGVNTTTSLVLSKRRETKRREAPIACSAD